MKGLHRDEQFVDFFLCRLEVFLHIRKIQSVILLMTVVVTPLLKIEGAFLP